MEKYNECPNEIEEIFQGEELLVEGCIYDDDDEPMDLADYTVVAEISSREGLVCRFHSESEKVEFKIEREPDKGVFSFVVPADITSVMKGMQFIAMMVVDPNGEKLITSLYSAFEVKRSNIGK